MPKNQVDQLVFVLTLLLVFAMSARLPLDNDLWWHLRAGEEMLKIGKPLTYDLFSFTRLYQPWISHSWLSEILIYLLYSWKGYLALSGYVACLAVLSMVLVYIQMQGTAIFRSFWIILGSIVSSLMWSPRPQMISFVLMGGVSYLLFLYRHRGKNVLGLLPFIFILWSNLHGGYSLGLMLLGLTVVGEALNCVLIDAEARKSKWKNIGLLGTWLIVSSLVVVINPHGFNMWKIPFLTLEPSQRFIEEWASPDFHHLTQQSFLWLFFAIVVVLSFYRHRVDISDLLIFMWFAYQAFISRRFFTPFAIAVIPIASRYGWVVWHELTELIKGTAPGKWITYWNSKAIFSDSRGKRWINLILVAVIGMVGFLKLYLVTLPDYVETQIKQFFPVSAVQWLQSHPLEGNLLNEYDWGGFLIWNLRDYPVFIDGRMDLYGDGIINEWWQVIQAEDAWAGILDQWDIRFLLIQPNRPVVPLLEENGWKMVFRDKISVIYVREGGHNN